MKFTSLHGAYFPNNYGDVLILAIQAKWIKELTGEEVSLPFATNVYRKTIEPINLAGKDSIIKSNYLIYGAGGYLGEPPLGRFKWSINFIRNHFKPAWIASRNNVPYSIIGTGAGPANVWIARQALKFITKRAEMIAVRDEESKIYLSQFLKNNNKINITADVALSLTKDDLNKEIVCKVKEQYLDFEGMKIGVHIGADRHAEDTGQNVQSVIDEIIQFFKDKPELTPVLIIDNNNKVQNEAVEYIKNEINRKCSIFKHEDIWETSALLSELDTVVTNKLHIGIVNYAMGNVPISFPYHSKTKRFYKQIGLENLCTPISEVEEQITYNSLSSVYKNIKEGNKKKYQQKRSEMMRLSLLNKKILKEVLNSK
ncbi:polysaccharide pyruvyl transferase family protein [Marinilactibacillus psychrotolerans]|uniref:Polysaccharide pyruvyl transferase domain-containing protein n=1 Tax=Marinilactibacillus psychrotolerans TaxID=191770 RepID=A0AAV3W8S7_9LACT|nr:polysaccharide pyruvyl transferase family protein [Marinilactibacillus psychrotolerans]GEL67568.1 hypothetical protein MPS01_17230 [Marinilactibacillus psychrotolerans]GEQ35546.1 hypothetical protein M132T_10540 [Marinilactibacillus psychrotolerans]SDD09150.1 Polysaccharide pyruvyl transferase family protein WcaK [Marinilactibacillus psychrotolerans]